MIRLRYFLGNHRRIIDTTPKLVKVMVANFLRFGNLFWICSNPNLFFISAGQIWRVLSSICHFLSFLCALYLIFKPSKCPAKKTFWDLIETRATGWKPRILPLPYTETVQKNKTLFTSIFFDVHVSADGVTLSKTVQSLYKVQSKTVQKQYNKQYPTVAFQNKIQSTVNSGL